MTKFWVFLEVTFLSFEFKRLPLFSSALQQASQLKNSKLNKHQRRLLEEIWYILSCTMLCYTILFSSIFYLFSHPANLKVSRLLGHPRWTPLPFQFHFLLNFSPCFHSYSQNFANPKTLFCSFYYLTCAISSGLRYDLNGSSCYASLIKMKLVLCPSSSSKGFWLFETIYDYSRSLT